MTPRLLVDILAPTKAPDPCDMGAIIRAAVESSGIPRADIVRAIAAAEGRTWDSVSAGLSKAMGRPDAGAEVLRAVCLATGRRVTTEPA